MQSKSIEGKVAIVTGAAKGIGEAIAVRYAEEGAKVVVVDINGEGATAVSQTINQNGGTSIAVATDVSQEEAVNAMIETAVSTYGTVDILVNNAGVVKPTKHFLEADKAWWDLIIDVNLTGTFLCSLPVAKLMAKKGSGVIINMSSGGATRAHRGFVPYDATKGGIEAMTRAMAVDLGIYGVRVNAIVPGSIDTSGMNEEVKSSRGANIPLGRVGEPEELAGTAVFLATDDASYITGHCFFIDGGMLAQQRSATADIFPVSNFPKVEDIQ